MLTVWERRYRNIEVVFAPAVVQGPEAPREIASALALLNELSVGRAKLDLIIVARGGGSPEELATYNDERVARAIFASVVPVVSAVGHEVDTTIADLVADLRAPTPSAAAEMVVPHQDDLRRELTELARRGQGAIQGRLTRSRVEVATTLQRIERRSPERLVEEQRRVIDELAGRARRAVDQRLGRARAGADAALEQLTALSPYMTLRRGYAICTRAQDGSVVIAAEQVQPTERVNLVLARGRIVGQVTERELAEDHGPKEPERA
jgi:exodeoxyribonuclease VII large subunit